MSDVFFSLWATGSSSSVQLRKTFLFYLHFKTALLINNFTEALVGSLDLLQSHQSCYLQCSCKNAEILYYFRSFDSLLEFAFKCLECNPNSNKMNVISTIIPEITSASKTISQLWQIWCSLCSHFVLQSHPFVVLGLFL